jgi:hypothetical protein
VTIAVCLFIIPIASMPPLETLKRNAFNQYETRKRLKPILIGPRAGEDIEERKMEIRRQLVSTCTIFQRINKRLVWFAQELQRPIITNRGKIAQPVVSRP